MVLAVDYRVTTPQEPSPGTQATRMHRVGKARARFVIDNPIVPPGRPL